MVTAIICGTIIIVTVIVSIFAYKIINKYLDIRDKEQKVNKFELYNKINVEKVETVLDDYFEKYVSRYIVYKFMAPKIIYIKQEDVTKMIKDVTKNILIEISDLYLYYISLVYSFNSQEELAEYIHNRVTTATIDSVTNYNNTNVPMT